MKLYNDLMELCSTGNFFYKDQVTPNGYSVRIFSYHYASYGDWIKPSALECRGIMFLMNDDYDMVFHVMCRPMEKFFNVGEHPRTFEELVQDLIERKLLSSPRPGNNLKYDELLNTYGQLALKHELCSLAQNDIDFSKVEYVMDKADGSLISSYLDYDNFNFKSKTSLYSEQAIAAYNLIKTPEYKDLYDAVQEWTEEGYTVNFEYVAPDNNIVLVYQKPELILLNIRDNQTGGYVHISHLKNHKVFKKYLVKTFDTLPTLADIKQEVNKEGYVVKLHNQFVKIKTDWYIALHRLKDSVNNNKDLFDAIVQGVVDDVKGALRPEDEYGHTKIKVFEDIFFEFLKYKELIEIYYHQYNHLDRKEYALKGQELLNPLGKFGPGLFSIYMDLYIGRTELCDIQEKLGVVFMKCVDHFIPTEYRKVKVQE